MSHGPRPVCELKAPTVIEGINDYQQEKNGADVIIRALNLRFPHGLSKASVMIMLPDAIDMATATMANWKPGRQQFPGICIERTRVIPERSQLFDIDQLSDSEEPEYSAYMFSEHKGWYKVTLEEMIGLLETN